jgi:flavorubredoxin
MNENSKYDRPIRITEGIYWVGFHEKTTNLHCNPYLIIEEGQVVLLDSGSRSDFAVVMMKILQAGIDPKQIVALIYQHYDPDLCGSMPNFIDMCEHPDLKVFSEKRNKVFISYYLHKDQYNLLRTIDEYEYEFNLNNRKLRFILTPYSHTPGSFVTYDEKTKTLFSGDLFGSFSTEWDLILHLEEVCFFCEDYFNCPNGKNFCPIPDIIAFHENIMPCKKSLNYAMETIKKLDIDIIAPQHGSVVMNRKDISFIIEKLESLEKVGIDAIY